MRPEVTKLSESALMAASRFSCQPQESSEAGTSLTGGGSSPAALGHQKMASGRKNFTTAPASAIPTQKLGHLWKTSCVI